MNPHHDLAASVRREACLCARKQPQRLRRNGLSLLLCRRCGGFILRSTTRAEVQRMMVILSGPPLVRPQPTPSQ
jgi:hypothetical protein